MKHIVSFSGGKDSTAMLLKMLEKGMPVDEIIFCDTGKEFPGMIRHINKVEEYINRPITRIKSEKSFDYYFLNCQVKRRSNVFDNERGYSWPDFKRRWCTSRLKTSVMKKYLQNAYKDLEVLEYVGIAADEEKRVKNKIYPLIEWGMRERECLEYCYSKGFHWDGLYDHFNRVSCWCCPLQSLHELRTLRKEFPELWKELQCMDKQTWRTFQPGRSVADLELRFKFEEERTKQGLSITNRDFFYNLKVQLSKQGGSED